MLQAPAGTVPAAGSSKSSGSSGSSPSALQKQEKGTVGRTAALSQAGYDKVAALKDDMEMKEFILRVIEKYDCKVENMGGLMGIVPWFSGTTLKQSLAGLEDTLLYAVLQSSNGGRTKAWLSYKNSDHITGNSAELSFVGYVQVAAMKSDNEMKNFVKRVCSEMGVKVVDDGGLEGMAKYYSGSENFQSFDRLKEEVKSAANAPHTWAEWLPKAATASKSSTASTSATASKSSTASTSATAYRSSTASTSQGTPTSSARKVSLAGFSLLAIRKPEGFCYGHPCRVLLQTQPAGTPAQEHSAKGMGKRATLDQKGYEQVANLKSDEEMKDFILRMVDKYDCKVNHMGGLMGIVPWFSGVTSKQDIQKLEDTLLYAVLTFTKNPWLSYKNSDHITGESAVLSFVGYVQVAAMRSDTEMKKFVKRLCKQMNVNIVDDGGFEGMVKFYSGTDNFQSFERLQQEIKSAANAPHSWAQWTAAAKPSQKK